MDPHAEKETNADDFFGEVRDTGKRGLAITGLLLALLCFVVIVWKGSTYTFRRPLPMNSPATETFVVSFDPEGVASVTDLHVEDRMVVITVRAEARGKTFLYVVDPNGGVAGFSYLEAIYVHPLGVMTVENYFGRSSGGGDPAHGGHGLPVQSSVKPCAADQNMI